MTFSTTTRVSFGDCDPAGVIFFARVFELAHRALEEMLQDVGIPYGDWFASEQWAVPLVKATADYRGVLTADDSVDIHVTISKVGNSSVIFAYDFRRGASSCVGVETVHVFIDKRTGQKIPIPPEIRSKLNP